MRPLNNNKDKKKKKYTASKMTAKEAQERNIYKSTLFLYRKLTKNSIDLTDKLFSQIC